MPAQSHPESVDDQRERATTSAALESRDNEGVARGATAGTCRGKDGTNRTRRVLVLSTSFPSRVQPVHGVFVKERVRFVSQLDGTRVLVVSPGPYFPPIKCLKRWYPWSQIPKSEVIDGLEVMRPRYFLPPELGGYFHDRLMYPAAVQTVKRVYRQFDFDLIDAHFAYPNGVVAARLGERFGKPVVITGRGEDIERFPDLPIVGKRIRWALVKATQLVAVSRRIAERMAQLGADPAKISVIPNGIDCEKFRPVPREQARAALGLPQSGQMILAVGYRLELKGFHLLVDALPRMRQRFPDAFVAIVGGEARWARDYLPEIEKRIRANGVKEHVVLAGTRPQDELTKWYSAADLLCILSSREGSPNVLMEALACGLPAVATAVGGIPEVLSDSRLGMLLPERSADAAAKGIIEALSRTWNREHIRRAMEKCSWHETAKQVNEVFDRAVIEFNRQAEAQ